MSKSKSKAEDDKHHKTPTAEDDDTKANQHADDEEEDDGVDHWKTLSIAPEDVNIDKEPLMLEESSFATLFPQYREKYLKQVWGEVSRALKAHFVEAQLDLVEGSMTVRTTRKTFDPFILFKARDCIKLLARSVPYQQAIKVLEDDKVCDIIKIGSLVRNKEKFVKRRQRLLGPNGQTLKAIELLTECYVLVQGSTVAAIGTFKGVKTVRAIAEDCMKNVHPVYHIKELMIKRELERDPQLQNESWDRFLPHFKKRNVRQKKPQKVRETKEYTPFPPAQQPRQKDIAMETGEFFLSKKEQQDRKQTEMDAKQAKKTREKQQERQKQFIAPKENKRKREDDTPQDTATAVREMANKIKSSHKQKSTETQATAKAADASSYIETPSAKKQKKKHSKADS